MTTMREIILCSTPRSGSTLLAEAMYATGMLGCPDEFFNHDENNKGDRDRTIMEQNWQRLGATGFLDYCDRLHAHRASVNGVHGVKMHFKHFRGALERGYFRRDVARSFVWVRRSDKAAQAASLAIAITTQQWNSRMTPAVRGDVEIPDELLARCYRDLIFDDLRWEAHFGMFGILPLELGYDDLVGDLAGCLGQIASGAGVELGPEALGRVEGQISGRKQAGGLNADLVARLSGMGIEDFGPGNILHDTGVLTG